MEGQHVVAHEESPWTARDGSAFLIRPIRPDDEPLMVAFHAQLTDETVYARYLEYLGLVERTAHERLLRVCFNDYDSQIALVAEELAPGGARRIVGIGRLSRDPDRPEAEFAILVGDRWQRRGLGSELLRHLVRIGRDEGLTRIWAEMLASNRGMRRTSEAAGFTIVGPADLRDDTVHAELRL